MTGDGAQAWSYLRCSRDYRAAWRAAAEWNSDSWMRAALRRRLRRTRATLARYREIAAGQ